MMRLPSGSTNKYANFVAVDDTDGKTRLTGISSWTVYRSRNGGTSTLWSSPTIVQLSSTNQPGEYAILINQDTTLSAGQDDDEMIISISATGMRRVTRVVEIYRPKITLGETVTAASGSINAAVQSIVTNAVSAAALATDAVNEIVSGVWGATTRILTAGTNIVLSKGAGVTGFNDVSTAQVRAEVDAALSSYDAATYAELVSATNTVLDAVDNVPNNTEFDAAIAGLVSASSFSSAISGVNAGIADIPNNSEFNLAVSGLSDQISALPTNGSISDAVFRYAGIEGAYSFRQLLRLYNSALLGKVERAETADPIRFYSLDGSDVRISSNGDQYGNRSQPAYDAGSL